MSRARRHEQLKPAKGVDQEPRGFGFRVTSVLVVLIAAAVTFYTLHGADTPGVLSTAVVHLTSI